MTAFVHRLSAAARTTRRRSTAAIAGGTIEPTGIVAILGKTEGNGCVNDFTRAFAVSALRDVLARHLAPDGVARVSLVMSGGTEGGLAPHWLVLERRRTAATGGPALAIGSAHTPDLAPEHLGRRGQALTGRRGRAHRHGRRRHRRSRRRALRPDQVPAARPPSGSPRRKGAASPPRPATR